MDSVEGTPEKWGVYWTEKWPNLKKPEKELAAETRRADDAEDCLRDSEIEAKDLARRLEAAESEDVEKASG